MTPLVLLALSASISAFTTAAFSCRQKDLLTAATRRRQSSPSPNSEGYEASEGGLFVPRKSAIVPIIDPNGNSQSGISYNDVLQGIDLLFPPDDLNQRTALSRKDGYWPFIQKGEDPPKEFVYGEFDILFFAQILDHGLEMLLAQNPGRKIEDVVFCDLGSGTGRLILAAAALNRWKLCRGIELLPSIHEAAMNNLEKCRNSLRNESTCQPLSVLAPNENDFEKARENRLGIGNIGSDYKNFDSEKEENDVLILSLPNGGGLAMSRIELSCGSFYNPYEYFGDADFVFVFSTAMPAHVISQISRAVGRQCKPGCIVVTTEYKLPLSGFLEPMQDDPEMPSGNYRMEILHEMTGQCSCVGGVSTVYFHRVVESLWQGGVRRVKPSLPVNEIAYQAIKAAEQDASYRSKSFVRNVANNMAFHGFPDSWRPRVED